jgi:hypothetical protein
MPLINPGLGRIQIHRVVVVVVAERDMENYTRNLK